MGKVIEPIIDRKIRFALAGCGRISANHFNALEALSEEAELSGICDVDPAALAAARDKTGAAGYASLADMLDRDEADVIVLTTPSGLHPAQAIAAARAGRHVVTEKPMATRLGDGLGMVEAFDEEDRRLFVVKQNRYNPTLMLLKRAIEERRFGRIYNVAVNVFWTRPQEYYDSAKWRGTWEFDGGALMNQASHYIDLLDWLVGPVESVMAYTATLARNIEVEDVGVAALRWRNGAVGTLNVSMLTHPRNFEGSFTIIGETGTVRIGGVALNKVEKWQFADPAPEDAQVTDASYETASVYGNGHQRYYEEVIRVLRGEQRPITDGREGLRSLELLIALYLSARDGARVALPLQY
ncbi:Gfo/Idh/MocA family protein [Sphingosinicella rhizophila]|uniref:Gfo/Idh/MocA family oxidoreductase n=1 Tax=Sphingosinicella rhizophila TaxID=3050082 RepID=A0ABU3Q8A0_9SPHN|nr:Gfo/Idh/MocA family oxidoreductase [Sphingosinicella sp. GR2756]MDT9599645.1 Gfo/Idh/MocA family oxidoreductase [Sphingosinicella sp. GR2756]